MGTVLFSSEAASGKRAGILSRHCTAASPGSEFKGQGWQKGRVALCKNSVCLTGSNRAVAAVCPAALHHVRVYLTSLPSLVLLQAAFPLSPLAPRPRVFPFLKRSSHQLPPNPCALCPTLKGCRTERIQKNCG